MHIKSILFGLSLLLVNGYALAFAPIKHWQSSQGGRVYFVKSEGLPMVDIRLLFDAGSARDGQQQGIASLTARLLETGTGQWDADQLAQQFDDVGARYSYDVVRDNAWLGLRSLTDTPLFDQALLAFQELAAQPQFAEADFQRIKSQVLIELKQQQERPDVIAKKTFYQALYGQHAYAHLEEGSLASVQAITLADIKQFYQQYYVLQNAMLVIVGDMSEAQARQTADTLFSRLAQGTKAGSLAPVIALGKAKAEHIAFPSTQTHVLAGLPVLSRNDADYFPLYVGNYTLGGSGLVSRLFEEIREQRGLAYSAYSYFLPLAKPGPFMLGLQTQNKQTELAISVLKQTLNTFIDKGPTQAELEAAKKNLTGGFVLRFDNNRKLLNYVAMIGFYQLPLDYLETFQAKVSQVTVEDIKAAFQRRVHTQLLQVISVGGNGEL